MDLIRVQLGVDDFYWTVRVQLELTLMTSVRWLHYCTEGRVPWATIPSAAHPVLDNYIITGWSPIRLSACQQYSHKLETYGRLQTQSWKLAFSPLYDKYIFCSVVCAVLWFCWYTTLKKWLNKTHMVWEMYKKIWRNHKLKKEEWKNHKCLIPLPRVSV